MSTIIMKWPYVLYPVLARRTTSCKYKVQTPRKVGFDERSAYVDADLANIFGKYDFFGIFRDNEGISWYTRYFETFL